MSLSAASSVAYTACIECKERKRKCDKVKPRCNTCTRGGRTCQYEDVNTASKDAARRQHTPRAGNNQSHTSSSQVTANGSPNELRQASASHVYFPLFSPIDPFCHHQLRRPMVDVLLGNEASKIIGTIDNIGLISDKYFKTIHTWMPIIAKGRYSDRLPGIWTTPHADFIVLTLCMHLITQSPGDTSEMQSSLYVTTKRFINLLESTGYFSVEVIQSYLLISIFEMSHAIHPAASISIAACARIGDALELNKKWRQERPKDAIINTIVEEERRVWWATIVIDRYINLCNRDDSFCTKDPKACDLLPMHDALWGQNAMDSITASDVSTSPSISVGPLARECQVSYLIGRMLRHVVEPTPHADFNAEEAIQLERTLVAYNTLLMKDGDKPCEFSCATIGMCSSALMILYDSGLKSEDLAQSNRISSLRTRVNSLSAELVSFSHRFFGDVQSVNLEELSPFVPHSLSGGCHSRPAMDEDERYTLYGGFKITTKRIAYP